MHTYTHTQTSHFRLYPIVVGKMLHGSHFPVSVVVVDCQVTETNADADPADPDLIRRTWSRTTTVRAITVEEFNAYVDARGWERDSNYYADLLLLESYIAGVPEGETVFCDNCQETQPAHGSNVYANYRVCNRCLRDVEEAIGQGAIPEDLIRDNIERAKLERAIDEIERTGHGWYLLPSGLWADIDVLYSNNAVYQENPSPHWPEGYAPAAYHVYTRTRQGYFNTPEQEIFVTSRHKLCGLMEGTIVPQTNVPQEA
jgi:hypothetical protein